MEIKAIKLSKKGLLSLSVWRFCLRMALLVVSSRRLVLTLGDLRSTAKGGDLVRALYPNHVESRSELQAVRLARWRLLPPSPLAVGLHQSPEPVWQPKPRGCRHGFGDIVSP